MSVGVTALLPSPPIKSITVLYRWVEVGQASVVMAISSPHRHDGQQAVQHCISQLKAKIPIWKKVRALEEKNHGCLPPLTASPSSINRRFTTHRTAAGRRTLNVPGPLTAKVPRKRQITSDSRKTH